MCSGAYEWKLASSRVTLIDEKWTVCARGRILPGRFSISKSPKKKVRPPTPSLSILPLCRPLRIVQACCTVPCPVSVRSQLAAEDRGKAVPWL